ncbi:Deflagellation inducible protein [Giardia muris]|uniref:Deflagellation inducible protein n=1 Tax=Giardia muris TaxID=5742 RepID=A0A4Z1SV20_GIAMU|nr:Deflagellation inducible protein [Giardia muris]|eukprot:TNJ29520.1 Deflagellation inducible protein [Giardia muris]
MATQGSNLQTYNNDLVKLIEALREQRSTLDREIHSHQEDKAKIERDITMLQQRHKELEAALIQKTQARAEYDKTIRESELAYNSIVESSKKLVGILKDRTGTMKM